MVDIFNKVHNRQKTRSVKWDMLEPIYKTDDVLPLWVADMDFQAPKGVNDAIIKRAQHGIYGYTMIDEEVKDSIIQWLKRRHNWEIKSNWLSFSPGVVTSLHIAIQALTKPNDKIIIQTPVYPPFFDVIKGHQRKIVKSSLIIKDNVYQIDFVDLEEKMKQGIKAFILCSPHNPVGRVWTNNELKEIARLCVKYDILIFSDEIHADLIYPGNQHIPIASLSDNVADQTITFMSPTKTFNLAGLQASYIITQNRVYRDRINQWLEMQGVNELNTMGITALEAAYSSGEAWLDGLIRILTDHRNYVIKMFELYAKELKVFHAEGTYLLWIDCSELGMDSEELLNFMVKEAKVGLNPGISYGEEGAHFMRINIACPRKTLEEGINRIIRAVNNR